MVTFAGPDRSQVSSASRVARVVPLAAAWDDAGGLHHVGVLELIHDSPAVSTRLRIRDSLQVPTRAHAVVPWPDGNLVAVARRPGAWMLRWQPGSPKTAARWCWSEPDRSFNGHVVPCGPLALVTTETDAADGAGLLVHRDARTLAVIDEWPTRGVDPHAVLSLPDGTWLVANGGILALPERGRAKGDQLAMDSNIVQLDAAGRMRGIWRLHDKRLSLRHLARHGEGVVGVALQAEHDDAQERRQAPLLALWDGQQLRPCEPVTLDGYAGDIIARPAGFLLGATRAGSVAQFDLTGRLVAQHPLARACALAPIGPRGWLAGGVQGFAADLGTTEIIDSRPGGFRVDNHWTPLGIRCGPS
jgi:hypothetical protein